MDEISDDVMLELLVWAQEQDDLLKKLRKLEEEAGTLEVENES